ncbi:DMT family transporter [Planomonospora venezuelensis]|uniref:Drug/metabolite transporter (DMT)-like permease n=1 Tax=Planomonospora venezuelensis TaxID=1999 RepID=A0A841D343_PLAVE|nr:DMT family transporter [Planomonospora venezuelensis]MBB5962808.1 drug/metabolite transporter (DMT)-like permease [Planomonospora venezuelensis]GIM99396.1 membrane protein [Planomonospora venezuelensis]
MNTDVIIRRTETRGLAQAAGAMFLVGTLAGVAGVIQDYPLYGGQALRYLLAAAVLLAVARVAGPRPVRLTPRETALLAALSLTGLVVFNICVIEATRHGGPALVGTVLGTVPLALALLDGRPSPRVIGAAAVVVAGATVATGLGSGDLPGLLWSLGALVCEVCFSLLALPLLPRLGAIRVSAYSAALAVPLLAAAGLLIDGAGMVRVPTFAEAAGLGYQSIIVTTVAFFLWYDALPRLGPARAGLFAGLIPVGAIATGALLGLGAPSAADLAGAALVVTGIAIGLSAPGRGPRGDGS